MSNKLQWLIAIGKAIPAIIGAAGAVACILVWLEVKPKDVRMMTWPHWLWLLGAMILFAISLTSSLRSLYLATRGRSAANVGGPGSDMKANVEEPPLESKLKIYSADYRPWKGAGETFDVTDFLRRIISGNSLVHSRIENDSFVANGKNYVPRDPLFGQPKRLQVTYSYDGEAQRTIHRSEHDRLVLPEDSGVDWLTAELDKAKAEISSAKSRNYPRQVFTLEKAWFEGPATSSTVILKNKVRMILTNHLDKDVYVWTPLWESTEVQAEGSPPGSTIQMAKRGWEFDEWEELEKICVTVPIGRSFRTYVALRPVIGRSISERMRTGDWIGTALLPTKIDGKLYEIPIEIGKKPNLSG